MDAALDEAMFDSSLRERLKSAFKKLADWFRNDVGNEHDKHH